MTIMPITAQASPMAKLHQLCPRNFRANIPLSALRKWPPITLRGCENGASGKPNNSTQVAPNEPRIKTESLASARSATVEIAIAEPSPASKIFLVSAFCGSAALSPLSLFNTYSHSIVPGGLLVTSKTTRFTSRTSFVIRVEIFSSNS